MDPWFPINCRCKLEGFVAQHSCLWNQHPLSPLSIKCKYTLNNCVNHEKEDFLILMRDIWITVWTGSQRMFADLSSFISFLLLCLTLQFEQILEVAATVIPLSYLAGRHQFGSRNMTVNVKIAILNAIVCSENERTGQLGWASSSCTQWLWVKKVCTKNNNLYSQLLGWKGCVWWCSQSPLPIW